MPFRKTSVRRRVNAAGGLSSVQFYWLLTGQEAMFQPQENPIYPFRDEAHEKEAWEKYHREVMLVHARGWPNGWGRCCGDLRDIEEVRRECPAVWALTKYGMPAAKPTKRAKSAKAMPTSAPITEMPVIATESPLPGTMAPAPTTS